MNVPMVKRIMYKDWAFNRFVIGSYAVGGLISLLIVRYGSGAAFHLGIVLLLTIILGMGVHMAVVTVVHERKEKTLPFLMSLPISMKEYTTAKLLVNLTLFFIPWVILLIASLLFLVDSPQFPNGLIPFVFITMIGIFMGYVLLVCLSLVSESMAWTVAGIIAFNLLLQVFIHLVPRMAGIAAHIGGESPVWNTTAIVLVAVEVVAMVLILTMTYFFQSRKRDFT